jgi:hypothetical protein
MPGVQARFIIRPEGKKHSRLLVGLNFPKSSSLKPGVIYEIVEYLDEYVIREIGKPGIDKKIWNYEISSVVSDFEGRHLMTEDEYKKRCELMEKKEEAKAKRSKAPR